MARLLDLCERPRDPVALVQGALREEAVEVHAEPLERLPDLLHHQLEAAAREGVEIRGVDPFGTQPLGELGHVLALVAPLGDRLAGHPRRDRAPEQLDLGAVVVDVVLALDLVAAEAEHARERVAVCGVAARRPRSGARSDLRSRTPRGCAGAARPGRRPRRTRRPASRTAASESRNQASDRNRLRKPGPATSIRSSASPSPAFSAPPTRSATSRGGVFSAGASSIATFVEKSPNSARGGRSSAGSALSPPSPRTVAAASTTWARNCSTGPGGGDGCASDDLLTSPRT